MTALIFHGHFYQPPRENPWTDEVEQEVSAAPYHDWNERIHAECYGPNAAAAVGDQIVNNYAQISFNFGPTLLSWMEKHHPETYARIIAADKESFSARSGHGNAIAQAYGHAILPLCNDRDRLTQVVWGMVDFRHRFGREPESMWLPETACNDATLDLLIEQGLRFVILAPAQASRYRALGSDEWHDVADGSIDGSRPYSYFHRDRGGRSIAIFFYNGPLARAIAFEKALTSSERLVRMIKNASADRQMINIAIDGETVRVVLGIAAHRAVAPDPEAQIDDREPVLVVEQTRELAVDRQSARAHPRSSRASRLRTRARSGHRGPRA